MSHHCEDSVERIEGESAAATTPACPAIARMKETMGIENMLQALSHMHLWKIIEILGLLIASRSPKAPICSVHEE